MGRVETAVRQLELLKVYKSRSDLRANSAVISLVVASEFRCFVELLEEQCRVRFTICVTVTLVAVENVSRTAPDLVPDRRSALDAFFLQTVFGASCEGQSSNLARI